MPNPQNSRHRVHKTITFLLGLAFLIGLFFGGFYVVSHFKEIAVSLNLPFTPPSWYPDQIHNLNSSAITSEGLSSVPSNSSVDYASPEWLDEYLSDFIYVDFEPFSKTSEINNDSLILLGIITAVKTERDIPYSQSNDGETIVPSADVKKGIEKFFDGVVINNKALEGYPYNATKKEYYVPSWGLDGSYKTIISQVNKLTDGKTEVVINYYNYDYKLENNKATNDKPIKTMVATLKGTNGEYKIISLKKK